MKKVIFLFVVFCLTTSFSFVNAKVSNTQIANVLKQNEKILKSNFKDLNCIYPGKLVLINLPNDMMFIKIKKGDNLWNIIKKILVDSEKAKNLAASAKLLPSPIAEPARKIYYPKEKPIVQNPLNSFGIWTWVFLCLCAAILSFLATQKVKQ